VELETTIEEKLTSIPVGDPRRERETKREL